MKILLLTLLLSLQAQAVNLKTYIIKKGAHYPTSNPLALFSGTGFVYSFQFDTSAIYTTKSTTNQGDINKLAGFSDCSSHHQTNSARLGWRWVNNELQIFAYNYAGGARNQKKLGAISLNVLHTASIQIVGNQYEFQLDQGKKFLLARGCSGGVGASYKLYPYFGGDETAPHEIKILLNN